MDIPISLEYITRSLPFSKQNILSADLIKDTLYESWSGLSHNLESGWKLFK